MIICLKPIRINVKKISSLKELLNKPIEEVTFNIKSMKELDEISASVSGDLSSFKSISK